MNKKLVFGVAVLLVLVVGAVMFLLGPAKRPILVSRTDPPAISFDEEIHELGTVMEGVEVPYTFQVNNLGGEPLVIEDVSTSCGCTLLNLKDKIIAPGKSGALEVIMDTSMKQGYVKKAIEVYSNDPDNPKVTIFLAATVVPNADSQPTGLTQLINTATEADPHGDLTPDKKAKIFTGQCATCHVDRGQGKLGKELFEADCAMCHGQNAEGVVGPALVPGNYHDPNFMAFIEDVTRNGSKTHLSMPGFSQAAGGPLSDEQIQSILDYLQQQNSSLQNATELPQAAETTAPD